MKTSDELSLYHQRIGYAKEVLYKVRDFVIQAELRLLMEQKSKQNNLSIAEKNYEYTKHKIHQNYYLTNADVSIYDFLKRIDGIKDNLPLRNKDTTPQMVRRCVIENYALKIFVTELRREIQQIHAVWVLARSGKINRIWRKFRGGGEQHNELLIELQSLQELKSKQYPKDNTDSPQYGYVINKLTGYHLVVILKAIEGVKNDSNIKRWTEFLQFEKHLKIQQNNFNTLQLDLQLINSNIAYDKHQKT